MPEVLSLKTVHESSFPAIKQQDLSNLKALSTSPISKLSRPYMKAASLPFPLIDLGLLASGFGLGFTAYGLRA
jgi:hypothetical protein